MKSYDINLLVSEFNALLRRNMKAVVTDHEVSVGDYISLHEISCPGAPHTGRHINVKVSYVYRMTTGPNVASVEFATVY
jgi:hypothetical protein